MRILLSFILLFTVNTLSAEDTAENCINKSVDTTNMPKNNNQTFDLDWCFAWGASSLVSFYEKTPLSSYDVALQYHNHEAVRDESDLRSRADIRGVEQDAMIIALTTSKGICLESETNYTDGDWEKLGHMVAQLVNPNKSLKTIICENNYAHSLPFKNIPPNILKILNKLSADKKMAALLDVTCGKRHKVQGQYGTGFASIEKYQPATLMKKLDDMLTKEEPTIVSFDLDFLQKWPDFKKESPNHSSVVIARRFNNEKKSCEYLIKHTAGDKCLKKTPFECEKGNYWVPRNAMSENIFIITWLSKK